MASPLRMEILGLLAEPQRHFSHQWSADPEAFGVCMNVIAEKLGLAQPTVSRHLDILRQAGFITVQRHQKWSYCKRDDAAVRGYLDWIATSLELS